MRGSAQLRRGRLARGSHRSGDVGRPPHRPGVRRTEVKEKLAKALAFVALGDTDRLRYQVDSLAEHLDDENDLVRYHLCTALVVLGCAYPRKLDDATTPLRERLDDDNPYVQGRAVEALGLLAGSDVTTDRDFDIVVSAVEDEDALSFLTARVRFCRRQLSGEQSGSRSRV